MVLLLWGGRGRRILRGHGTMRIRRDVSVSDIRRDVSLGDTVPDVMREWNRMVNTVLQGSRRV